MGGPQQPVLTPSPRRLWASETLRFEVPWLSVCPSASVSACPDSGLSLHLSLFPLFPDGLTLPVTSVINNPCIFSLQPCPLLRASSSWPVPPGGCCLRMLCVSSGRSCPARGLRLAARPSCNSCSSEVGIGPGSVLEGLGGHTVLSRRGTARHREWAEAE